MKHILTVCIVTMACCTAVAKPRTLTERQMAAQKALKGSSALMASHSALPSLLEETKGLSVMGYPQGGYAIVANDDMYPEVLGVSQTTYRHDTSNENFKWWLRMTEEFVSRPRTTPFRAIQPNPDKFPTSVVPMVKSRWGQDAPYSNLTPGGCPTGCVATAAAQVLRYHKWPEEGRGVVFTYYPYADYEQGRRLEENIEGVSYQYDKMRDIYDNRSTGAQQSAVATLMYHVGLTMKAQYGYEGTGAYSETLSHGLRRNLGYPFALTVAKNDYTAEEWMDMVFGELSQGRPLIYGGTDSEYNGHEFVLHGYNSSGRVYVNWGWGGSEDGYYDLSSLVLMWGVYNFNYHQDMIVRVSPECVEYPFVEVELPQPGMLADVLGQANVDSVVCLAVKGAINGSDLAVLRMMAGVDSLGKSTRAHLSVLDLSEASIVAGGSSYLIEGDVRHVTADNELPYKAFSHCASLVDVTLPYDLVRYGDGAFSECHNLDTVRVQPAEGGDFVVMGSFVLSADSTQLIEYLPSEEVNVVVPSGVTCIHGYAFAGRYLYERLSLPETLDSIGEYAFNRCFDLQRTYVYAEVPPKMDATAVDMLDISLRTVYVPKGSRNSYRQAAGWKAYGSSQIVEFDPTLTSIRSTRNAKDEDRMPGSYDLAGRRLNGNAKGRIVVTDGKKYAR